MSRQTVVSSEGQAVQLLSNESTDSSSLLEINGQSYSVDGGFVSVASLADEWYEDVIDPQRTIAELKSLRPKADVFTFRPRLPEPEACYNFKKQWQSIAALPVTTYDEWITKQVERTVRNKVRKAQKAGVEVREVPFDDDFVRGMVEIFNESRIRQGRPFSHYGKDFETVRREFSRFLFREDLLAAYYNGEMIGFVMIGNAGRYAVLGQFISKFAHRDKATNNLLIAKAVEVCAQKGLPYLIYGYWAESSLVDFKRQSGFNEVKLPRYFVPLTPKGKLALSLGFDRLHGEGWKEVLPRNVRARLKELRTRFLSWRRP